MKINLGKAIAAGTVLNYALEGCGFRSFCIEVKESEAGQEGRAVQAAIKGTGLSGFIRLLKFGFLLKKGQVFANTLPGSVEDYNEAY